MTFENRIWDSWDEAQKSTISKSEATGTVEIYPSPALLGGVQYRFRVRGKNGENLDPEGHSDRRDAWRAMVALSKAMVNPRMIVRDYTGEIIVDTGVDSE